MRLPFFRIVLALVVASMALGGSVLAADAPSIETTPIPTNAKPDWSSMKFLLGTWNCSSLSSRRPAPYLSTGTATFDSTGYWMVTKTVTAKVAWAPATTSVDMVTYDPYQHRWVDVYTDDQGNYDVTFSPGWKGNTMAWTDALFAAGPDIIAASPVTVTKVSDTKTTSHGTFTEKSGTVRTSDTTCTKAG
jgi:hypothetical protein